MLVCPNAVGQQLGCSSAVTHLVTHAACNMRATHKKIPFSAAFDEAQLCCRITSTHSNTNAAVFAFEYLVLPHTRIQHGGCIAPKLLHVHSHIQGRLNATQLQGLWQ